MTTLQDATVEQLRKLVSIKEQIETLQGKIEAILGNSGSAGSGNPEPLAGEENSRSEAAMAEPKKRRRMSAGGRAAIAAAQRTRWAKIKGNGATHLTHAKNGKSRLSAAGKAAIIAGTKARWAKIRAAQGKGAPKKKGK